MARTVSNKRVALYARVSTAEQKPDLQLDDLRALAHQRGWKIVGEFVEQGVSGAKVRRPELDRLMKEAKKGRIDIVVCWRFDRFARSVRHLVTALDEFNARGIDFVSVNDGIDTTTPAGRFTFHVIAAVAELEREILRERVRAGMTAAKKRGKHVGRPRTRVDLARALSLRAGGKSYKAIAEILGCGVGTVHRALAK